MKEFKFRGETFDGKIISGGLVKFDDSGALIAEPNKKPVEVQPDTVKRLICRDILGHEVYEDDEVILKSAIVEFIREEFLDGIKKLVDEKFSTGEKVES